MSCILCWGLFNYQNGYEMTWVRIDQHIVILCPFGLGKRWPNWVRNDLGTKLLLLGTCTNWPKQWVRNDQSRYEMTWVRNDLGTKWLETLCTYDFCPCWCFFLCGFLHGYASYVLFQIRLHDMKLHMSNNGQCQRNIMEIYDGTTSEDDKNGVYCDSTVSDYSSLTNRLYLRLRGSRLSEKPIFSGRYTVFKPGWFLKHALLNVFAG